VSGTDPATPAAGDRRPVSSRWWWLLVVVLLIGGLVLLVLEPWSGIETEPALTGTHSPPSTVGGPSPTSTLPGADVQFDAQSLATLFVTPNDLVANVPAAGSGVSPIVTSGQVGWGLPVGSAVAPADCVTATTVVPSAPPAFDARSWGNSGFQFQQQVTVLASPADAQAAFRALVTTIDACPSYAITDAAGSVDTWVAKPAIEGQGTYPSIVQEITHGTGVPGYRGQMLVGNAIVTWTATALGNGDPTALLATLGDGLSLSTMVQEQARSAVAAMQ
jgi:hypothetical protein